MLSGDHPSVSVVVSVLNEERHLPELFEQLAAQTYTGTVDVLVAEGGSTDQTRRVIEAWAAKGRLRIAVIDNPRRVPAAGFNLAIAASTADVIILLGGHMHLPNHYIAGVVHALVSSGAECAGGVIATEGSSATGCHIAAAMSSPFGVGHARFRIGIAAAGPVDTVAFAGYPRATLVALGGFDEDLIGAEDDELNFRIARAGGVVWLDPAVSSTYYCRDSYPALFRQYFAYGRGKARVLRKHRTLPSLRALTPTVFVLALACAIVSIPLLGWLPLVALGGAYVVGGAVFSAKAPVATVTSIPAVMAAFLTMHLSYGLGFLAGRPPLGGVLRAFTLAGRRHPKP